MKVPKQINLKTAILITLLSILISSLIIYTYAQTPSSTFTISPGIYPGAPAYTIWREGNNYFAKDVNGLIVFSGTNISQISNNCIESLKSEDDGWKAGEIHFKNGAYEFTNPIIINKCNIILKGEGRATELKSASASLDTIILVYTPTGATTTTHAIVIENLLFYNPNWQTYNNVTAIRFHNNVSATYGIAFPTIRNCWFIRIDGITTDTQGFTDWEHQLITSFKIQNCIFDHPIHFAIKLWNAIDGFIENIYATRLGLVGTGYAYATGIELIYPQPLSAGVFFDDVSILGMNTGINITNGAEGWFQSVVTDICEDYGFFIKNCNRTMLTNTYSSTNSTSKGVGYALINSYFARLESCTAFNCKYGVQDANYVSDKFNYFIGTISTGCATDWYNISNSSKFSACNYIVQNGGVVTGYSPITVTHGLTGTPNVVVVTCRDEYVYGSVTSRTSNTFTITASEMGSYTFDWYACLPGNIP